MYEADLPYYEDLDVAQGSAYKFQIQMYTGAGSRKDLTLVQNARGTINYSYQADDSDAVEFSVDVDVPPTNGLINCTLQSNQTQTFNYRRYLYNIELDFDTGLINDSAEPVLYTQRVLEGKILVNRGFK